jgi:hypothetical protein
MYIQCTYTLNCHLCNMIMVWCGDTEEMMSRSMSDEWPSIPTHDELFCRSLFVLFSLFLWSLCCLSFYLRILITLLVSSNSSYTVVINFIGGENRSTPKPTKYREWTHVIRKSQQFLLHINTPNHSETYSFLLLL